MTVQELRSSIEYKMLSSAVIDKTDAILSPLSGLDERAAVALQVHSPDGATIYVRTYRDPKDADLWGKVRDVAEEHGIDYRISDDNPPVVTFDIRARP